MKINEIEKKYPELYQFLGGVFHQDWNCDFKLPEDAIRKYIKGTHSIWIKKIIKELKTLLRDEHTFEEWESILYDDFGCEYYFDYEVDYSPKEFLEKVLKQFEKELPLAKDN